MGFRLVQKSVNLNDLELRNCLVVNTPLRRSGIWHAFVFLFHQVVCRLQTFKVM